jgi:hypothetical protein
MPHQASSCFEASLGYDALFHPYSVTAILPHCEKSFRHKTKPASRLKNGSRTARAERQD